MDVADAAILTGVLGRLFDAGWVLVATCNRMPADFESSHTHREHPQARLAERDLHHVALPVTAGWVGGVATCCRVIGAPASFGAGRSCRPGARLARAARAALPPRTAAAG